MVIRHGPSPGRIPGLPACVAIGSVCEEWPGREVRYRKDRTTSRINRNGTFFKAESEWHKLKASQSRPMQQSPNVPPSLYGIACRSSWPLSEPFAWPFCRSLFRIVLLSLWGFFAVTGAAMAPQHQAVNDANNPLTSKITLKPHNYDSPEIYGLPDRHANQFLLRGLVQADIAGLPQLIRFTLPVATA
jgi:hypothetical protein